MITNTSTLDEINAYIAAKTEEYMDLSHEMEQLRGRDQSAGRRNFLEAVENHRPSQYRNAAMIVAWFDDEVGGLARRVENERNRQQQ